MFKKIGNKNDVQQEFQCTIRFLDDSEPMQITFRKEAVGQWLVDQVCSKLNLVEKDYFGLRFVDAEKQRHWLDPLKPIHRQLKGVTPTVLCFRVKFYPDCPSKLHEEITRYFLFLQLRRDLQHGRLLCTPTDANILAAYIIQSEVGDYDPEDHPPGYVAEFKMLPKQNGKMEEKIAELHQTLVGQVPSEAEANFLKKASTLDTYGVDPHQVKDQKGNQLYLGITHQGVLTFQGNRKTHQFKWSQIHRIAYEGKMFIVHVAANEDEALKNSKKKNHAVGFKCPTVPACKYLWKCAVEQQLFFTLSSSNNAPKVKSGSGFFSRGSKFRFSGRCLSEVYAASNNIRREEPPFTRSASNPNFARRVSSKQSLKNTSLPAEAIKEESAVDVPQTTEAEVVRDSIPRSEPISNFQSPALTETKQPGDPPVEEVSIRTLKTEPIATILMDAPPNNSYSPMPMYEPDDTLVGDEEETKPKDLDLQIRELEQQWDMIKNEPQNHVGSNNVAGITKTEANHTGAAAPSAKPTKPKGGISCVKILGYTFFFVVFSLTVSLAAVWYFDIQHPYADLAREQIGRLQPVKDYVDDRLGSWFKS
ncbi:FERM domain-containing protein 5-like isoform X2 [Liolophura sinensis]|uniref:FERM domain-containing protein 5-like isoform X2 n=1 Tax=Liolophura sinensis TaxID=3198878 RepID=UPI00315836AA